MPSTKQTEQQRWWKEAVVYQIYPASFKSTGSGSEPGWGDIKGITSKLDYLQQLGVDVVWVSPIYKSPQADMGYDISDYEDIDPRYGTLSDVDDLIKGLKQRNMKLMMDLVVNHTSDQHAWFLDSRSSKASRYRDWYIWKPARYDADGNRIPPNNWLQLLGDANSAWTWDEKTQEYYLSLFTPEQPDLNWENEEVRKAVHNVLRFWLERGASGFRMDVINLISKVQTFPDAAITDPSNKYQLGDKFFANGPRLHEFLQEINREVLSHYDTITVGEMPFVRDQDEVLRIVAEDRKELNMIFIFDLVDIDNAPNDGRISLHDFNLNDVRTIVNKWQTSLRGEGGWNSLFIENHDQPRSVSRYVDDSPQYREVGAKLLALMQTTLSGTLYVYQGEELGMDNVPLSWGPEEYKDIETINYWKKMNDRYPGDQKVLDQAKRAMRQKARDNARTPVHWTAGANAGFCDAGVTPWMRVNDSYKEINAESQQSPSKSDDLSVLQFWERALKSRKEHKNVFVYGDFQLLDDQHPTVLAYKRASPDEAFVTLLNFSGKDVEYEIPSAAQVHNWVAGNYTAGAPEKPISGVITLRPWEGVLGAAKA